jgi:hypothetical protein
MYWVGAFLPKAKKKMKKFSDELVDICPFYWGVGGGFHIIVSIHISTKRMAQQQNPQPALQQQQQMPNGGVVYYEGTWKSDTYPWMVAHGSVAAEVNFDTKRAKILLHYEGTFKYGTTVNLETKIEESKISTPSTSTSSSSVVATASAQILTPYVFTLTSSSNGTITQQDLEFTASSITLQAIYGNYKSAWPADHGAFIMHVITKHHFDNFPHKSSCTIA